MIELLFAMLGATIGLIVGVFITSIKVGWLTAENEDLRANDAANLNFMATCADTWRNEMEALKAENRRLKIAAACGHHQDDIHEDLPRFVQ